MNNFVKNENVTSVYNELHKIKPDIYTRKNEKGLREIKLSFKKKDVFLMEFLKDGLTDYALLTHNGVDEVFKSVYEAELRANEILRSK